MKNISKYIARGGKFIFTGIVFLFVLSLSYEFAQKVYPSNAANQLMMLALYDVAALIWLIVFILGAEGTLQRALSLTMFFVSLLGVMLLVAAETLTTATSTIVGLDMATITGYATWSIVILAGLNLLSGYLYYIVSPANIDAMISASHEEREREFEQRMREKEGDYKQKVQNATVKKLNEEIENTAASMAAAISQEHLDAFHERIGVRRSSDGFALLSSPPAATQAPLSMGTYQNTKSPVAPAMGTLDGPGTYQNASAPRQYPPHELMTHLEIQLNRQSILNLITSNDEQVARKLLDRFLPANITPDSWTRFYQCYVPNPNGTPQPSKAISVP